MKKQLSKKVKEAIRGFEKGIQGLHKAADKKTQILEETNY